MEKDYAEMDNNGTWNPRRTRVLMVLVVIITAIAIWLVPDGEEPAPTMSLPSLPAAPETTEELALPPPSVGIATVTGGGDGARAYLYELRAGGAEPDADVVFTEAERLQGEGNLEDAYLLYRFAARHGQAQAALNLGTQADPAYHATTISYLPEPEPGQAYTWYSAAAVAGNQEAPQRLLALRQRVAQDAANGNEQAQRLMLQWQ